METVNGLRTLEVNGADLAALIISNEFEDFEKHDRASLEQEKIAYMYRDGAKDDVARLERMLQQDLQCNNISKAYNCNELQLKAQLTKFCEAAERAKCLLIFAASHGNRDVFFTNTTVADARSGKDHGAIPLHNIWNPTVNAFGGQRPIIFFFQCCRGSDWDTGRSVRIQQCPLDLPPPLEGLDISSDSTQTKPGVSIDVSMPNHADVVLAFATVEDHASYRYKTQRSCSEGQVPLVKKGSYFLTALCEAVRQREETQDDLIRLLTRVNRRVASEDLYLNKKLQPDGPEEEIKVKQCICVQSALTMKIYFKKNLT